MPSLFESGGTLQQLHLCSTAQGRHRLSTPLLRLYSPISTLQHCISTVERTIMADSEEDVHNLDNLAISESGTEPNEVEEELARFAPVISSIDFSRLERYALELRNSTMLPFGTLAENPSPFAQAFSCTVQQPPFFGSYHILWALKFDTGETWLIKVPAIGHKDAWDGSAAEALRCEALTMRMISMQTSIPLPHIYDFNDQVHNDIGCPFVLMDHINGMNGQDARFDASLSRDQLEKRRERILRDVGQAMLQLGKFTFVSSGAPIYRTDPGSGVVGQIDGTGPMRVPDTDAALRKMQTDDSDDSPVYREISPIENARDFLLEPLGHRNPPADAYSQGVFKLLRQFIEWLPLDISGHPFMLTPPDFDIQNVLVKEDGSLSAIIDWDGVAALPRCIGNEKLPSWPSRDWDPAKYAYGQESEGVDPYREDSPADLARYRAMYAKLLREAKPDRETSGVVGRSLLVDNLYIAADDPMCTDGILAKVFEKCILARKWALAQGNVKAKESESQRDEVQGEEIYLYDLVTELENGEFNAEQLSVVREGFEQLCLLLADLDSEFWFVEQKREGESD